MLQEKQKPRVVKNNAHRHAQVKMWVSVFVSLEN
jgi:hypothetical protein